MIDFQGIAADLLARSESFCRDLLPAGKKEGHEWRVGNVQGEAGHSLSINLSTGVWKDWAHEGDAGADLVSLFAAVRGLSQGDAARALRPDPIRANGNGYHPAPAPFIPPPPDAPGHAALYRYTDTHYIARFEQAGGKKSFRPYTWSGTEWLPKAHDKPRPLFNLDDLAARPDTPVMVVEGEKTAQAAAALLGRYVVVTWAGGASSVKTANWASLYGRWVDIWPDADEPGRKAGAAIAELLAPHCATVRLVDTAGLAEGWDLADAVAEGMDAAAVLAIGKARVGVVEIPSTPDIAELLPIEDFEDDSRDGETPWRDPQDGETALADVPRGTIPGTAAAVSWETPERAGSEIRDTDIANGKRLAKAYGHRLKFTPERDWLIWDGTRWRPDDRAVRVQNFAKDVALAIFDEIKFSPDHAAAFKHAKISQSRRSIESMIFMARSEIGIPTHLTDFDRNPWVLNLDNGTLDLRTGDLMPHAQSDHITKIVPITYAPGAVCERWQQFIEQITDGSEELMGYLQRLVGYCLTGTTDEQVLHFLFGLGANGKSVFSEVLAKLLGEYAMVAPTEMIVGHRHGGIPNDIARLRGMRLALMNETNQGSSFDEAKLKELTGGDTLTGRFLRAEFFDFTPTHKLIIRGNHKPAISGTDDGIWRRLRLIPFTVQIPIEQRDPNLLETLRGELPGILNWALAGCMEWQSTGLNPPEVVMEACGEYRLESDTLGNFISECCTVRKLAQVKSSIFFKAYQEFAKEAGERWMPNKDLPHEMRRRGFEWKKTMKSNVFEGIELIQRDSYGSSSDL